VTCKSRYEGEGARNGRKVGQRAHGVLCYAGPVCYGLPSRFRVSDADMIVRSISQGVGGRSNVGIMNATLDGRVGHNGDHQAPGRRVASGDSSHICLDARSPGTGTGYMGAGNMNGGCGGLRKDSRVTKTG
jgi:hypothetical protein